MPVQQGFFDLFREQTFCANLCQCDIGALVARSLDDFDTALPAELCQAGLDPAGLPQSQLGSARSDYEHSILQMKNLPDGFDHVCPFRLTRLAPQLRNRPMRDLVDDATRQSIQGFFLLRSHRSKFSAHPLDLRASDLLEL